MGTCNKWLRSTDKEHYIYHLILMVRAISDSGGTDNGHYTHYIETNWNNWA